MVNSIGYNGSLFGQAVLNLNNQLTNLSTQLATGTKSTTYSGMGVNEGFAIAARAQLANISSYGDTISNLTTTISAANTALQSISNITSSVQSSAATAPQNLNSSGQTIAQQNAQAQLSSLVGILNTQVGDRFIFSGSAINTPPLASDSVILGGSGALAGLKQVIAERAVADGTSGFGRLVLSSPATTGVTPATTTTFSLSEDSAASPFGLKLSSVQSNLTGATVSGPSGSPAAVQVSFGGATNPNPGETITVNFNLPDGTTAAVQLSASSQNPPPTGSFTIATNAGAPDPVTTAANLNAALNTAIAKLANTQLVAASAIEAGHEFFDPSSSVTGTVANNKQSPAAPITAATALAGTSGTNSIGTSFQNGDTITVNGTTINFSSTAPSSTSGSPYVINTATGKVGDLLSAIDSITGTSTPSSIDSGAVTINTPNAATFSISAPASDPNAQNALASLGFGPSGSTISAAQPPLRVGTSGSVTGAASSDQQATPQPVTSATLLVGATGSASLSAALANNDVFTVNGKTITFSTGQTTETSTAGNFTFGIGAGSTLTVGNLLSAIDAITGTTKPSTISNGAITINTPNAAGFSISALASDPTAQAALGALGFSQASGTATQTAGGTRITAGANSLINGSATTVSWYNGNNATNPRASSNALIDSGISVNYGIQANEEAIRQQIEGVAVFAAVTEPATTTNSAAQISALSSRIATNLTPQPGQQQLSDIQTDLAIAQTEMKAASTRQTQTQTFLQNMVSDTENVSTEQVASQILALQNALSASYQTTSILSKLTLTNFL